MCVVWGLGFSREGVRGALGRDLGMVWEIRVEPFWLTVCLEMFVFEPHWDAHSISRNAEQY